MIGGALRALGGLLAAPGALVTGMRNVEEQFRGLRGDMRDVIASVEALRADLRPLHEGLQGIRAATEELGVVIPERLDSLDQRLRHVDHLASRFSRSGRRSARAE